MYVWMYVCMYVYVVLRMNYEPGAPCEKCFFFKCKEWWSIFEAYSGLKSRGLGDFGSRSGREEIIEKLLWMNVRGLSSVG